VIPSMQRWPQFPTKFYSHWQWYELGEFPPRQPE
jgi:hypothetical protein